MVDLLTRLRASGLVAALLVSALAAALLAARIYVSGNIGFAFLSWNLALAWVPLLAAYAVPDLLRRGAGWGLLAVPLLTIWLAFLPNAPYLVTDLQHLKARPPIPIWFDAALMCTFAAAGLVLTGAAIHRVWQGLKASMGLTVATLVVIAVGPLVGMGLYLGRFLRWNSWDLVFRPMLVLGDLGDRLVDPWAYPRTWAVTVVGAGITWVAWGTLASLRIDGTGRWAQGSKHIEETRPPDRLSGV